MRFRRLLHLTLALLTARRPLLVAQTVALGIKVGVEATHPVQTSPPYARGSVSRGVIGPVFEVALPRAFAFEASALRKRAEYRQSTRNISVFTRIGQEQESETTAHSWEVPLVLKKYVAVGNSARAYGDAGFSLRHTSGTTHVNGFNLEVLFPGPPGPGPPGPRLPIVMRTTPFSFDQNPSELNKDWIGGLALGGGLDFKLGFVGLQPELRYTRWSSEAFRSPDGSLRSNRNSLDVLFGVTFRK